MTTLAVEARGSDYQFFDVNFKNVWPPLTQTDFNYSHASL